jgi:zinc protease
LSQPPTPTTTKRILPNGLTILLRESHRAAVVELQIWANVGSADERPGEEGLAHFHEHMLFKGTERRAVGDVAGDVEGLGGQINAYTSFDSTVYHATMPADAWREGLDVLVDAVRHSVFEPEEVEREREVVLEEIRRSEDTPGHVLSDLAFRESFRVHPYGQPILGPAENVASFDRARVRRFFERWYTPEHLMVVAVGDFDSAEMTAEIKRLFGDAKPGQARRERPTEPAPEAMRIRLLRRPFEGHRVDLTWPGPCFADRDSTLLDLLAYVLGECESSRLIRQIREQEGLVDRIDAGAYTPLDRGLFSIGYQTDGARLLEATRRIIEETDRLRHAPVSQAELDRARINFLASEQFDRESVSGLAAKLGSFEAMGGGWEREAEVIALIQSATPEDLLRVARTYLRPEALTLAALLPEESEETETTPDAGALDENALREAVERGYARFGQREKAGLVTRAGRAITGRKTADGAGERFDAELASGLRVHVLRRPEIPIAAVRFASRGGLLRETEATSGITRFLAAMWTRGTRRHSAAEFARESEWLAAEIDGFSGRNSIGLTLDSLSETLEPALDLFAEALLTPGLDPEEIERERRDTLAALERREDRLGQKAFQLFAETEFERHPYRLSMMGRAETVSRFDAEALAGHARSLLRADRSAIAIVGDVDPERVIETLEEKLAALPSGGDVPTASDTPTADGVSPPANDDLPEEEPRGVGLREIELVKDRAQAHLVLGFRGLTLADPDRHALELISQLLAGQGGRLFLELRDRQSLAYTVAASNVEGLAPGYFSIYIATAPDKIARARAGILEELERLVDTPPGPEEIQRAIRYASGGFAIDSQRSHARAAHLALDSIYGLGPDSSELYPSRLASVTPEDVLRVARRVFRLDAFTVSSVHP